MSDDFSKIRDEAIKNKTCPAYPFGCSRPVSEREVLSYDKLTRREYLITGMCKECQDKFYAQNEDMERG